MIFRHQSTGVLLTHVALTPLSRTAFNLLLGLRRFLILRYFGLRPSNHLFLEMLLLSL